MPLGSWSSRTSALALLIRATLPYDGLKGRVSVKRQCPEFNPLFNASCEAGIEQREAHCDQWGTSAIVLQLKSTMQYFRTPYPPSFADVLQESSCDSRGRTVRSNHALKNYKIKASKTKSAETDKQYQISKTR
jgi:hypothetical protein